MPVGDASRSILLCLYSRSFVHTHSLSLYSALLINRIVFVRSADCWATQDVDTTPDIIMILLATTISVMTSFPAGDVQWCASISDQCPINCMEESQLELQRCGLWLRDQLVNKRLLIINRHILFINTEFYAWQI